MVAFAAKLFKARDALAPFAAVTDALQGDQAIFTLFDGIVNLTQHVHTHRAAESWATIAHEEVNRRWLTNWINDAVLLSFCVSPISWAKLNAERTLFSILHCNGLVHQSSQRKQASTRKRREKWQARN